MSLTAWAQEEKAKRESWYENDRLRKRITGLEKQSKSRSDTIIEYSNMIADLQKKNAELEKENQLLKRVEQIFSDAPDLEFSRFEEMFPDEFEVHNIEQQAKGIEDACHDLTYSTDLDYVYVDDLQKSIYVLRNQAKALRGE